MAASALTFHHGSHPASVAQMAGCLAWLETRNWQPPWLPGIRRPHMTRGRKRGRREWPQLAWFATNFHQESNGSGWFPMEGPWHMTPRTVAILDELDLIYGHCKSQPHRIATVLHLPTARYPLFHCALSRVCASHDVLTQAFGAPDDTFHSDRREKKTENPL
jgi:hypothetical protein